MEAKISEILKPYFDKARDRQVTYMKKELLAYKDLIVKLRAEPDEEAKKPIYRSIFGYYDTELKKTVGAIAQKFKGKDSRIFDSAKNGTELDEEALFKEYDSLYTKKLDDTVKSIWKSVEEYSPSNIELAEGITHDLGFHLTLPDGVRTYTINTIIAGGDVQSVHLRTLTKLHKGRL